MSSRFHTWLYLLGLTAAVFTGCTNKAAQQGFERPPAPVSVTEAVMQDVPNYIDAIGKTVAREVVSIQPQVSGRILKIHFTDGSNVNRTYACSCASSERSLTTLSGVASGACNARVTAHSSCATSNK